MAKKSKTTITQGVDEVDGEARAWTSIEFRMKLADYEGVTVALGMSQPVENNRTSIKRLLRQQGSDCEDLMSKKVTRLREIWEDL